MYFHCMLRVLLCRVVDAAPASIVFERGAEGKPRVVGHPDLHFSMSHSQDVGVVAISLDGEVGVDVEVVKDTTHEEAVMQKCFTGREKTWAASIGDHGFLVMWTVKEAAIKRSGTGLLSMPHLGVEKLHAPDDHDNVHVLRPTTAIDFFWSVSHLDDPEDFKDSTQCFVSTIIRDTHVFSVAHAKPNCRPRLWENVEC
jgi:4'-phosphopantetheinyl transferase